jgi:hypothetical protein
MKTKIKESPDSSLHETYQTVDNAVRLESVTQFVEGTQTAAAPMSVLGYATPWGLGRWKPMARRNIMAPFLVLKMEAVYSSETLVSNKQIHTALQHKGQHRLLHPCENVSHNQLDNL